MSLAFSARAEAEIQNLLGRYPVQKAALIPVLFVAQTEFGYLSPAVIELVASRLAIPEADVLNTATFYTMLHKEPVGRVHVQVCCNVSCFLRGSDEVLAAIEAHTGCKAGDVSEDGRYSVERVECLAACDRAPCMQVNEDDHFDLDATKAVELVSNAKEGSHA